MTMELHTLVVGQLQTNCYILCNNEKKALVIDPGENGERIAAFLAQKELTPLAIINTHGHYDHVSGNAFLQEHLNLPVYFPANDEYLLELQVDYFDIPKFKIDYPYTNEIKIPGFEITVIPTPGHTSGGCCLLIADRLFSGDTMFASGSYGRTDLWGGSYPEIMTSLKKLLELPPMTKVYPGHGSSTTLSEESAFYAW